MIRKQRLVSGFAVLAVAASAVGTAATWAAAAPLPSEAVVGAVPSWTGQATDLGATSGQQQLTTTLYLGGQDPAGLAAYARAVSDPRSPAFHHYLSAAEALRRFGPDPARAAEVAGWLKRAGFTVTSPDPQELVAQGSVAAADNAFGVALHDYRLAGNARRAPQSPPRVPANLATAVVGISGLDTTPSTLQLDDLGAASGSTSAATCSDYFGQQPATSVPAAYGATPPWSVCGYASTQLRGAYGLTAAGLDGSGSTVAIVLAGAVPDMLSDANAVAAQQGGAAFRPGQYSEDLLCSADDSCTGAKADGFRSEEILDVEAVHAIAPGANVRYVGTSTAGTDASASLLAGLTDVVDRHLADVVSDSWYLKGSDSGIPADVVAEYEHVFQLGAVEGIGFAFGAGDAGDQSFESADGHPSVNFPAADPWVTAVGGTSLAVDAHDGYAWETGWGDKAATLTADGTGWNQAPGAFIGGSGGGRSTRFAQPFYQRGTVPAALSTGATGGAMRVLPDIAADADPYTGLQTGAWQVPAGDGSPVWKNSTNGGTSLATPLIAGIEAAAQQAEHGVPIGFANPVLYALPIGLLHDVTDHPLGAGTPIAVAVPVAKVKNAQGPGLITFGLDTGLQAGPGYDDVTGLGSPSAAYLKAFRRWH
ncbi:Peptidase S53 propeptide [Catenulispora acidiphila DSM 44928]|uniref:Peptidase S53 propeptide n=1 Tax=Catenulispora acidiphila (strain DSM 44928 / JCM 14897 / NBRC 102108 / NRRL B-24433 / ID139908) TaxID=479433 RepID=C7Q0B4_CATAD|nr:S53 family peptidase [Catenulispora acidiphila]ACU77447.1 Peptidase S53 propeptide [Catenulispora acidiphila DSM 44928]